MEFNSMTDEDGPSDELLRNLTLLNSAMTFFFADALEDKMSPEAHETMEKLAFLVVGLRNPRDREN